MDVVQLYKGFTLIELLVAITIIGILAAIGIPIYMSGVMKAEEAEVFLLLDSLEDPIKEYRILNNDYPNDVVAGVDPGLGEWPEEAPFNSPIDYEHWGIGSNTCVVLISHFGRDKQRDSPAHVKAGPVGSIVRVQDDFIKTVAEYPCDRGRGAVP